MESQSRLLAQTFRDVVETVVEGEAAGRFPFDLDRVNVVLSAIARALAYRDFGLQYQGQWRVFCATLLSRDHAPKWDQFRSMVSGLRFDAVTTPQPEVFAYGINTMDIAFVYQLTFYEGFIAYAWPVVPDA